MGIREEVFKAFYNRLRESDKVPDSVFEKLKHLLESRESVSQERLFEIVRGGHEDISED